MASEIELNHFSLCIVHIHKYAHDTRLGVVCTNRIYKFNQQVMHILRGNYIYAFEDIVHLLEMSLPFVHPFHYSDVITSAMASQITGVSIVYSIVCSGADQRKHQCSASLTFVSGIHQWPANPPHEGPVTGKMFPFHNIIMHIYRYDCS